MLMSCRQRSYQNAADGGQDKRNPSEGGRHRQGIGYNLVYRTVAILGRQPEITMQEVPQITDVLVQNRSIQFIPGQQRLLDMFRQLPFSIERPTRHQPDQKKRDADDAKQNCHQPEHPFRDEPNH